MHSYTSSRCSCSLEVVLAANSGETDKLLCWMQLVAWAVAPTTYPTTFREGCMLHSAPVCVPLASASTNKLM